MTPPSGTAAAPTVVSPLPRHGSGPATRRGLPRWVTGFVAGLGVFLLVVAVLLPLYVYPHVVQLPDNPENGLTLTAEDASILVPDSTSSTSVRQLDGVTASISNYVTGVPGAGNADDVVWQIATQTSVEGRGMVNSRVEVVSLNRHTSAPVNCCGDRLLTQADDSQGQTLYHVGYYTFPFHVKKQSYQLWDVNLKGPRTTKYEGSETVDGVHVYRFTSVVPLQGNGYQDLPGGLFGLKDPSVHAQSTYADTTTYWIEPASGATVKMRDQTEQKFTYGGKSVTAFAGTLNSPPPSSSDLSTYKRAGLGLPWLRGRASIVLVLLGLALLAAAIALPKRSSGAKEFV